MAKNAKEVVGVDHEEHKIEMAKQAAAELGINNVKFVHGDLRDSVLREKLGKFDLIVAWGLLHRISDPIGFLYDIADMGCCLSLEWRTPILPGSQFISLAYHNPLSNYLDPSNLRQTIHSKEKAKKIEAASGFWEPSIGATKAILRRCGFTGYNLLGFGDDFNSEIKQTFLSWASFFKQSIKRQTKSYQLPIARVHVLFWKEGKQIMLGDLGKARSNLPQWDLAINERANL